MLQGLEFLAEDAVFVAAHTLKATGVANYLHVSDDSLRWLERSLDRVMIRRSPVIRRRSGVSKFEVDLRHPSFRLASAPQKIVALVFLSTATARGRPLLRSLPQKEMLSLLESHQSYAANQLHWRAFGQNVSRLDAFELRRGRHPREGVEALRGMLGTSPRAPTDGRRCASP